MANEKKPEGAPSEAGGSPSKRPAQGETVERPVKRTGAVPKWSTGPMPGLAEDEKGAADKGALKRPSTGKQPAVGAGGGEKPVAKRASVRGAVTPPPVSTPPPAPAAGPAPAAPEPAPIPTTQPAVGLDAAKTQSLPSPFAPPKPPVAFRPEDEPIKTSTDIPIFLPPKPPAGYRPDDEESERTSTTEAVPAPSAEPPGDSRDGSTVLKKVDDLKRTDKPGPEPAKAFQAPKPPAGYKPDVAQLKTNLKPPVDDDDDALAPKPVPIRVAEQRTNIKDIGGLSEEAAGKPFFEPKTSLSPAPVSGEIKKTAAAEQRAREREAREGKGALDGKAGPLGLDDEETTAGGEPQPNPSLETLPHDSPAVAADGKPLDPKLAGAFSRAQAKEQAERGPPMGKATGTLKPPLTRDQRIAMGVVGGGGALIFLVLLLALAGGFKDRPSAEDLERCYPYGQNGAMGPNGQRAPAVALVKFKFDQELEEPISRDFEKCLVVKYEGPGVNATTPFQGSMVMCKRWDKIWKRGNDDGMPFRIAD